MKIKQIHGAFRTIIVFLREFDDKISSNVCNRAIQCGDLTIGLEMLGDA